MKSISFMILENFELNVKRLISSRLPNFGVGVTQSLQTGLLRWLQARHMPYVIRLHPDTLVHYRRWRIPFGSLDTLAGAPILLFKVEYRGQNPVRLNLVISRKGDKVCIWPSPSAMPNKPRFDIANASGLKKCTEISRAAWG